MENLINGRIIIKRFEMVKNLEIRNFKSIKHLELDCKKINIFIGKPNTGKSNILEAIGFLSAIVHKGELLNFVRFETMLDLFYDGIVENNIVIRFDDEMLEISFEDGRFNGNFNGTPIFHSDYNGSVTTFNIPSNLGKYKFYRFRRLETYSNPQTGYLYPPFGSNLLAMLMSYKELKELTANIFREYGLRIVFKPTDGKIEVQKEIGDIVISFPYFLVSDTLQRIIFNLAAIETNKNSIITLEEPESHAFPYYTKFLAERICMDENDNQYFITTHNPYFLLSILEKCSSNKISVFLIYVEDYQTKAKELNEEDKKKILNSGMDIFFNIEEFLEG